jgi:hypothetical protein
VHDTRPQDPPDSRGDALVAELRWVHDMIRRDLAVVRRMASMVGAGLPAADVQAGIRLLAASGPLWQLKVNCLRYCRFVHSHHHAESIMLFPGLRRANPALSPVIDKLETDHLRVSDLLDEVEAAAQALGDAEQGDPGQGDPGQGDRQQPEARERLARALQTLSEDLLAHLQYEEEQISDTLRTWTAWPLW